MTEDEKLDIYNKGLIAGQEHTKPSPATIVEFVKLNRTLDDHITSNEKSFVEIKLNSTPSNSVLEVKLDALTTAIMGNGKPGLLERMEKMENWRSYMLGGMAIIVLLVIPMTVYVVKNLY